MKKKIDTRLERDLTTLLLVLHPDRLPVVVQESNLALYAACIFGNAKYGSRKKIRNTLRRMGISIKKRNVLLVEYSEDGKPVGMDTWEE